MVKSFLRLLSRWPVVESFLFRLVGHLKPWPADDFGQTMPPPLASSVPPDTFEMRFMNLHVEGRFDEMWEMLAEDAQRAWGGIQNFIREMPRLDEWLEILEMQVASVTVLDSWTDQIHQRTYDNVARLVMRYRVRQQWKEWTFDRQVHLIPAGGGWRTLCYPTRARSAVGR